MLLCDAFGLKPNNVTCVPSVNRGAMPNGLVLTLRSTAEALAVVKPGACYSSLALCSDEENRGSDRRDDDQSSSTPSPSTLLGTW